jgi:hypothetical protein
VDEDVSADVGALVGPTGRSAGRDLLVGPLVRALVGSPVGRRWRTRRPIFGHWSGHWSLLTGHWAVCWSGLWSLVHSWVKTLRRCRSTGRSTGPGTGRSALWSGVVGPPVKVKTLALVGHWSVRPWSRALVGHYWSEHWWIPPDRALVELVGHWSVQPWVVLAHWSAPMSGTGQDFTGRSTGQTLVELVRNAGPERVEHWSGALVGPPVGERWRTGRCRKALVRHWSGALVGHCSVHPWAKTFGALVGADVSPGRKPDRSTG